MSRSRVVVTIVLLVLGTALLPGGTSASTVAAHASLGQVRFILHGLAVQPPKHHAGKGKLKQRLYAAYLLSTKRRQKASVGFRDGSLLHLNQQTDAVLRSPSLTQVKQGEVEQQVVPGTSHQVQTAAAVAAAIGTIFDVKVTKALTIITVVEGAVLVTTRQGSVVVTSGQQVRVRTGAAPSAAVMVDAAAVTGWTDVIPPPAVPLGVNIALAANGGNVYRVSSQRASSDHTFDAGNINDGRLDRGWQSAAGATSNQAIWLRFQGERPYTINSILLDCGATGGQAAANDAKDFTIKVSTTSRTDEAAFTSVLSGSCRQPSGGEAARAQRSVRLRGLATSSGLQVFALPTPVNATYVELDFRDNYGGSDGIAVAEAEVISRQMPARLGMPTPVPTDTPTPVPTETPTSLPTSAATPTSAPTATATALPKYSFSFSGLHAMLTDPYGSTHSFDFSGQACGTDPLSASWAITVMVSYPMPATYQDLNTFAINNPFVAFSDQYKDASGGVAGSDTESLRLDNGQPAQMTLLVSTSGNVSNVRIQPSVVPITTGARCG